MTYELAKELKEAGFKEPIKAFSLSEVWVRNLENDLWYAGDKSALLELPDHGEKKPYVWGIFSTSKAWDWESYVYCPTLSELIEACGNRFIKLEKVVTQTGERELSDLWAATGLLEEPNTFNTNTERTQEEAVARLWLALNKKGT